MAIKAPWAILLCRYSDDTNDPNTFRVSDLYAQLLQSQGAAWLAGAFNSAAATDNRTILDLYQTFFTITGLFTFNVVRYFDEMSQGLLDVTGTTVFPCTLDLTAAESDALAQNPGGKAHQDDLFARAKEALKNQHDVNWRDFYGVVVSFQSVDAGGSQGGTFDGGPGAIGDIRYVRNNGTSKWGHEMGHGFGLGHSRTDGQFTSACTGGDPADYTDNWDVMSWECCATVADSNYGTSGPGLNAWNMRSRGWLDETRTWKGPPGSDFSERIVLHPLHRRTDIGLLCAELPGIGSDSNYLVELRVPVDWDAQFGQPLVVVHRYVAPNSFIMKGTAGQKVLTAGGVFEKGDGPYSRLKVESIDPVAGTAVISLCFSKTAKAPPKVKLSRGGQSSVYAVDRCHPGNVGGTAVWFDFQLSGACLANYTVQWLVQGAVITSTVTSTTNLIQVLLPPAHQQVTVTVKIIFDDGTSVFDTTSFSTISQDEANWSSLFCRIIDEARLKPIPWYEWDPERVQRVIRASEQDLDKVLSRTEHILNTLRQLKPGR